MALTAATQTQLYQFFSIAFDAAPGVTYMGQLTDAVNAGMSVSRIVEVFTTKEQFTSVYPTFFTNQQFATKLINNVVGDSASEAAKLEAIADVEGALAAGWSRGKVIYQIFSNLAAKNPADPVWGDTAQMMANKVAVAKYVTETQLFDSTNMPRLQAALDGVTADSDVSTPAKIQYLVAGVVVQGFTLQANAPTLVEGASGTKNLVFELSLPAHQSPWESFTVNFKTLATGTATSGEDFVDVAGTVTFAAGQTTATVSVPVTGDAKFEGNETISIEISGAQLAAGSVVATGTILNDDVANSAPVAANLAASGHENAGISGAVFATDADSDALSYSLVSGPANGVLVLNANGTYTYTPNANFNGTDSFTYKANDGKVYGNIATVTLNVANVANNLTASIDNLNLASSAPTDDVIRGSVSSGFLGDGTATTFNPGDIVDGGAGADTLVLFMDQGAVADGAQVSSIETLDLRLNASNIDSSDAVVVMSDWDNSLEQINITSNKSDLTILEQKTVADVSIRDLSTVSDGASYAFNYAEGVLDGDTDTLNLTVNNVNGEGGSDVYVDPGMEGAAITVADRLGAQYASDINLVADGMTDVTVDGGRTGQGFTLNANVASGAAFDSTGFAGNMALTSADIKTATFGAGSDDVTLNGQANQADSSYDLGEGDNTLTSTVDLAGSVVAGDGDDTVELHHPDAFNPSLLATGSIDLGNGNNDVHVDGYVLGQITVGSGDDHVEVGDDVTDNASITLGDGNNHVDVGNDLDGDATVSFGTGDDQLHVGDDIDDNALVTFAGGNNTVEVSDDIEDNATINFADGNDTLLVGDSIGFGTLDETVKIDFAGGDNRLVVEGDIDNWGNHATEITFGDGNNAAWIKGEYGVLQGEDATITLTFGDGNNELLVGFERDEVGDLEETNGGYADIVGATITFGDGTNTVEAVSDVDNSHITFGDGDGNTFNIGGDLTAAQPGTITFGDGDGNSLNVGRYITNERVVFGDGVGNSLTADWLTGADVKFGDGGENSLISEGFSTTSLEFGAGNDSVEGAWGIYSSTVSMGEGNDTVSMSADGWLGNDGSNAYDIAAVVDLGAGDDQMTMRVDAYSLAAPYGNIYSGGFVEGGEGNDTLTFEARGDARLIGRDLNQQVSIDLLQNDANSYTVGQEVTVTFTRDDEEFSVSYTVVAADIVQSDGAATSRKVMQKLVDALNDDEHFDEHFEANVQSGAELTITSDESLVDFQITSSAGTVTVEAISDAHIGGIENLELVALNGAAAQSTTISADFNLIDGVETILLDSQEEVQTNPGYASGLPNGYYETTTAGGVTTFELIDLKGGEAITVSGFEASATGNRQVERISVGTDVDDHRIGDKIVVVIGETEVVYIVDESDLTQGATEGVDANLIAKHVAEAIADAAEAAGFSVGVDSSQITLVGSSDDNVAFGVDHTRPTLQTEGASTTSWDVRSNFGYLQPGDVITVSVDGEELASYTVTEEDCARQEAEAIAEALAAGVEGAQAQWGWVYFGTAVDVSMSRIVDVSVDNTTSTGWQGATPADDAVTDVVINANVAGDDTTMDLTIAGQGNFDIALGEDSGFTDLDLKLGDEYSHTLYTNGYLGSDNFGATITVSDVDGVNTAGQTVVLDSVLAHTVQSTAEANLVIDQYSVRANELIQSPADNAFYDEAIDVDTGNGDDHLITAAQSALNGDSHIDLGAGENRLSLGWGNGVSLASAHLEAIGGMNFEGGLAQFDLLNGVVLDQDSTTLTLPGGADEVGTVTFADVDPTSGQPSDLNIDGVANSVTIESSDDLDLGLYELRIGSNPNTSNLSYDITPSDDGVTIPFTDRLAEPPGSSTSAPYVYPGHRIMGASFVPGFAPGVEIQVPDTFNGYGDNEVDNAQFEVYYGSYDAETGIFTVTLTPYNPLPEPGNAPTHTLVLYDNDDTNYVKYIEGFVFDGFFEERGFSINGDPGSRLFSFSEADGLYVPYGDGSGGGATLDVGTLTLNDAEGQQITGDLSVSVEDYTRFNLGNNDLASLSVEAGSKADVYIAANQDAEFNVDVVNLSSLNEYSSVNLYVDQNTSTDITLGDVSLQVDGPVEPHDFYFTIEGNVESTVTVDALTMVSGYGDANFVVEGNTDSTVNLESVSADTGCFAEVFVNDNSGLELTVVGGLTLDAMYRANFEVIGNTDSNIAVLGDVMLDTEDGSTELDVSGNTRTNVSLAVDGTVTVESCVNDAYVFIDGNLNDHQPGGNGPDLGTDAYTTYTVELGDLVVDAGSTAVFTIDDNNDDTFFGDLVVKTGDVEMTAYNEAYLEIGEDWNGEYGWGNNSANIELGNVAADAYYDVNMMIAGNTGYIYDLGNIYSPANRFQYDLSEISIGDLTLTSTNDDIWANFDYNDLTSITVGAVSMTADDEAELQIDDNYHTSFLSADVSLEGDDAYLSFTSNDSRDENDGTQAVDSYEIDGDLTVAAVSGGEDSQVDIRYNDGEDGDHYRNIEITVTGDVEVTSDSEDWEASFEVGDNYEIEVDLQGDVSIESAGYAEFDVYSNEETGVTVGGDLSVTSNWYNVARVTVYDNDYDSEIDVLGTTSIFGYYDAQFQVYDNDEGTSVNFADVELETTYGDANVEITYQDYSTVTLGDLTVDSGDDSWLNVEDNDDSDVQIGDVSLTAEGEIDFDVEDNDYSLIEIAAVLNDDDTVTRGTIDLVAYNVGTFDGEDGYGIDWDYDADEGVYIIGGYESSIYMGDLNVTAEDGTLAGGNDVNVWIEQNDEYTLIDIGDITVNAESDVYFYADEDYDYPETSALITGDITLTSGNDVDNADEDDSVWSDLFFAAADIEGAENIDLNARSTGYGEGNVYVDLRGAYDVEDLTVSGTNAEIYLQDDIGGGDFTLDLSGLTGSFSDGAEHYDPLGVDVANWRYDNRYQDEGSFVSTADADFYGDVTVKVGTGDLIYNAQHSEFWGSGEDFEVNPYFNDNAWYDWNGNEGWFSLGDNRDLTPVQQVQVLSFDMWDVEWEETAYFDVQVGGNTYEIYMHCDDATDVWQGSGTLGATGITWEVNHDSDWDWSEVIFTGPVDGSSFVLSGITDAIGGDIAGNLYHNDITQLAVAPVDGGGNAASETFEFADDIGEVVIGGFRPNGFFAESEVDRLDLSAFDGIGGNKLIDSAADLIITIDDNDGYFADVIIDFVDQDLGSIRLVGVGEYFTDANVNGIANSIDFA